MKHFDALLKLLFKNTYNDLKQSEHLGEILNEICFQINAKYISLKLYVTTSWLSVDEVIENFVKMYDGCACIYVCIYIYIYIYIYIFSIVSSTLMI